jgi:protein MAK16
MQHDEMIWQVINHQFCSYQATLEKALSDRTRFCRHPYSTTGLCNRTSCPLANSRYAVVREEAGKLALCIKTVERAHTPKHLWERVPLSRNYAKALEQIDEHLQYFPKVLIHRNKQRLTKIHQYLLRMRKLELQKRSGRKAVHVRVHRKVEQREERREQKALTAAKLEKSIEKELVERLAKGTYGDLYNFPEMPFQKALKQAEEEEEEEETEEESLEEEEEEEEEEDRMVEYVEDLESEEEEDFEDMEDMDYLGDGKWGMFDDQDESGSSSGDENDEDESSVEDGDKKRPTKKKAGDDEEEKKPKRRRRGPRVEIEYEEEREDSHREPAMATETAW